MARNINNRHSSQEVILPSVGLREQLPNPQRFQVLSDLDEARLHEMVAAGVELVQPGEKWNGFLTLLWNREEKAWGYLAGVRSQNGDLAQGRMVFGGKSRCQSMNFIIPSPLDFRSEPVLTSAMDEFEVAAANVERLTDIKVVADHWGPWFRSLAVGMERVKRNLPPTSVSTVENVSVAIRQMQYMAPAVWVPQRIVGTIVRKMWDIGNLTMDGSGMITIHDVPDIQVRSPNMAAAF